MPSHRITHKCSTFTSIAVRIFLLAAAVVLIGCFMVAVGVLLLFGTLVGLILALLVGLLCGGLLLVTRLCVSLTLSSLSAADASGTLSRAKAACAAWYRKAWPWFCLWIKRLLRCFFLFLLWQLWRWAASGASAASPQGRQRWGYALPT
jgi:hypothetical protein